MWKCGVLGLLVFLFGIEISLRVRGDSTKSHSVTCGGILTATHGVIQTPNFPGPFPVPLVCRWIIDASNVDANNPSIVVYLTQLYVFTGLTFHEYADYQSESVNLAARLVHTVTEQNVTRVRWLRTIRPFLVVEFRLDRLEGNHLRVLDNLLDVYGFNITYEISTLDNPVRPNSCILVDCSFTGNCVVSADYTNFTCDCFSGYSGPKCGTGPLCPANNQICHNGGTCSHVGANAATCQCALGFTGDKCDVVIPDPRDAGCGGETIEVDGACVSQCPFDGHLGHVCNCPRVSKPFAEKVRFETTLRFANLQSMKTSLLGHSMRSLESLIEKQMSKYLKNANIMKIEDLRILNITSGSEVTFHFFGGRRDSGRVRDALNRLIERGRLGNFTLAPTQLATKQEPTLLLQNLLINEQQPIREGEEFSLSCIAQGSSYMTFNWYKDGVYVNVSKATRPMTSHVLTLDSDDKYSAILLINKATHLDSGVYTCQAVDWGVQQCKSLLVDILLAPQVKIVPMSITLQKGDNVTIKCLSPNDRHHEKFGYNWARQSILIPLSKTEVWEDLHPSGSILKIYNAQKSTTYNCSVHGRVKSAWQAVRVEIVNRTLVPLCPNEWFMDILWPETAPGMASIQQCPNYLIGKVTRNCNVIDTFRVKWDLPNFSDCSSHEFLEIDDNFSSLTYGFQNTSGTETLVRCLEYVKSRERLYPGEGRRVLRLIQRVFEYINTTFAADEVFEATQTSYGIINLLLLHFHSIFDNDVVTLQRLVRTRALISGSQMQSPAASHLGLDSLILDIASLESLTLHNLHIPLRATSYPMWFTDNIDIRIESGDIETFGNSSFTVAITIYRNLSQLLPVRFASRNTDLQYDIISRLVNIEIGHDGNRVRPKQGLFWVDLELAHVANNYTEQGWFATCAVTDVATKDNTWDLDTCITRTINMSTTRCTCTKTGTFAVLWTQPNAPEITPRRNKEQQFIVLAGCITCLALSVLTLGLLLPYWWYHRTSLIFLKLQCCVSIAGAMLIFIYAVRTPLSQDSYVLVATALEMFLLVGMSSHLSKLLIVYTEIVAIPTIRQHLQQTVVGVITGVPILAVLINLVAYRSLGLELKSWWLLNGTLIFTIFVTSAGIMIVLFVFIYFSLVRKLHRLIDRHLDKTKALSKRIGLLNRAALIFFCIVSMQTASILYINISDTTSHYIFSFCCATVGISIFVCYILKCESSLHMHFIRKLKLRKNVEETYSSESVNSPLSFFTKQDGEVETDSAPPPRIRGFSNNSNHSEGFLMAESCSKNFYKYSEVPSGTIETYVHSLCDNSTEKIYPTDLSMQDEHLLGSHEIVDMERYSQNPKSYLNLVHVPTSMYGEFVEADLNKKYSNDIRYYYPEGHSDITLIRPSPGKCYIRDYAMVPVQEVCTTRACVEYDLQTPQNHSTDYVNDPNITNIIQEPTAHIICNVNIEPADNKVNLIPLIPETNKDISLELEESSLTESTSNSDIILPKIEKKEDKLGGDSSNSSTSSERKQPEGRERNNTKSDNLDGMLDRISHDLDYLLNRTDEIENVPSHTPPPPLIRKTNKPPTICIIEQIKEEDEEEEMNKNEELKNQTTS